MPRNTLFILVCISHVIFTLTVIPPTALGLEAQKIITSPQEEFSKTCGIPAEANPQQYAIYLINKEKTIEEQQQLNCMNQVLLKQMYESGIDPVQHLQESVNAVREDYKQNTLQQQPPPNSTMN